MSTIFSQQILSDRLLLVIISGQKCTFKLWIQIRTNNNLPHMICCENNVDVTLNQKRTEEQRRREQV